ncbi:DUF2213 domain-containing protein [Chitiniphilus eburneus]|uniref:DUF2213 domain-containing protein n=1 Tax=Chitiniphilus eburneus TaxID=2571148 RepID=UPI001B7FB367|nr:DUF2213 domain-containing protein [Chitiniphilus eburneus]
MAQTRIVRDASGKLRFYATEQLGPKQSATPEGFLICHDVAIARTGVQRYLADEVPIDAGPGGQVEIRREPDDVFRPETLASFEGKPVTVDHPEDLVNPDNWKELAAGLTQNVRRGDGLDQDLVFADLLIMDRQAIEAVRAGLREVSCGYEADYEQLSPGIGYQRNIVGNHVALVERGRAGARCAIQDKDPTPMSKKLSWADRLRRAFMARDAEAAEEVAKEIEAKDADVEEEEGKAKTSDALAKILDRLNTMDADIKALKAGKANDANDDPDKKETTDDDLEDDPAMTEDTILEAEPASKADTGETYTGDSYRDAVSRAEILAPGIRIATTDAARSKQGVALIQRAALRKALAGDHAARLKPLLHGRALDSLSRDALHTVFVGAAELVRNLNNAGGTRTATSTRDFGLTVTPASMNQAAQQFWANRK